RQLGKLQLTDGRQSQPKLTGGFRTRYVTWDICNYSCEIGFGNPSIHTVLCGTINYI
ncbi:unnamed protein product, partial [Rotaria magnacalcarata]